MEVLLTTAAAPGGNRTGEVWSVRTGHRGSTVATTVEIDGALAFGIEVDLSPSPPTSPYPLDGTAADGHPDRVVLIVDIWVGGVTAARD